VFVFLSSYFGLEWDILVIIPVGLRKRRGRHTLGRELCLQLITSLSHHADDGRLGFALGLLGIGHTVREDQIVDGSLAPAVLILRVGSVALVMVGVLKGFPHSRRYLGLPHVEGGKVLPYEIVPTAVPDGLAEASVGVCASVRRTAVAHYGGGCQPFIPEGVPKDGVPGGSLSCAGGAGGHFGRVTGLLSAGSLQFFFQIEGLCRRKTLIMDPVRDLFMSLRARLRPPGIIFNLKKKLKAAGRQYGEYAAQSIPLDQYSHPPTIPSKNVLPLRHRSAGSRADQGLPGSADGPHQEPYQR